MKKYKLAVGIGRFQIFHDGHEAFVDHGLDIADNVTLFLGSDKSPRTIVNPWTSTERGNLINAIYVNKNLDHRMDFVPLEDRLYSDTYWMRQIQQEIYSRHLADEDICLLGWKKDKATARYLNWFPQWKFETLTEPQVINATDIRNRYFKNMPSFDENYNTGSVRTGGTLFVEERVNPITARFLKTWSNTREYDYICNEFKFQREHDAMYAGLKYKPVFITVDSVVICSGHVLLIKRRAHPGKDLWALPGGYLNVEEKILDAAIRELIEETKIKLPEDVLRGSIVDVHVFDAPSRSTRGRIVTHAHTIKLKDGPLPKVKGADDAVKAIWRPFSEIRREEMFEDHYDIIHTTISRITNDRRK